MEVVRPYFRIAEIQHMQLFDVAWQIVFVPSWATVQARSAKLRDIL